MLVLSSNIHLTSISSHLSPWPVICVPPTPMTRDGTLGDELLSLSKTCSHQAPNFWMPKAQTDLTGDRLVLTHTPRRSGGRREHIELCPTMPRGHRADRRSTAGTRGVRRRSWLLLHPPERHGARPLRRFLAARGPQGDLLGHFTRATPSSSGCRTWEDRVQPAPEGSSRRKAPALPKPNILLRLRNTVPRHAKPETGT